MLFTVFLFQINAALVIIRHLFGKTFKNLTEYRPQTFER